MKSLRKLTVKHNYKFIDESKKETRLSLNIDTEEKKSSSQIPEESETTISKKIDSYAMKSFKNKFFSIEETPENEENSSSAQKKIKPLMREDSFESSVSIEEDEDEEEESMSDFFSNDIESIASILEKVENGKISSLGGIFSRKVDIANRNKGSVSRFGKLTKDRDPREEFLLIDKHMLRKRRVGSQ